MSTARVMAPSDGPEGDRLGLRAGRALQELAASHNDIVAAHLRVRMAQRRVERETTPSAFAEADASAAELEQRVAASRHAWLSYGRALGLYDAMPPKPTNEEGSDRPTGAEP